jgi:hypothetical protein
MNRRRYPLVFRLARIDSELDAAAMMLDGLVEDARGVFVGIHETQKRMLLLVAVTGSLLMVFGIEVELVRAWIDEMSPDGDADDADMLASRIIEQIILAHGPTMGEG